MSFKDVYIGRTDDSRFTWDADDPSEVFPERIGEMFPSSTRDPFGQLLCRCRDGVYANKQIDWGAWAAKVTRDQVREFVRDVYGEPGPIELVACIENLDPNAIYALVYIESV